MAATYNTHPSFIQETRPDSRVETGTPVTQPKYKVGVLSWTEQRLLDQWSKDVENGHQSPQDHAGSSRMSVFFGIEKTMNY